MTPMQIALMDGFLQGNIDLDSCHDAYAYYGIATVCDGDSKTADEIDDYTTEELCALMCDPPVWAKGLHPAFCGGIMNRYRK